jgi:hypothetical protein
LAIARKKDFYGRIIDRAGLHPHRIVEQAGVPGEVWEMRFSFLREANSVCPSGREEDRGMIRDVSESRWPNSVKGRT